MRPQYTLPGAVSKQITGARIISVWLLAGDLNPPPATYFIVLLYEPGKRYALLYNLEYLQYTPACWYFLLYHFSTMSIERHERLPTLFLYHT
ncbi:hypothetical protein ACMFMG_002906 [Clarireedia jacksonii]